MRESLFTETETMKLSYAIEEAAVLSSSSLTSIAQLKTGASEFCRILVETTELGLNALIAAAFHYCATNGNADLSRQPAYTLPQLEALESFGSSQAVGIARDSARLQKLERVASSAMTSDAATAEVGTTRRLSRDGAENLRKLLLSETGDWRGLAIRCSAALYRLRKADGLPRETVVRYGREALFIYAPLASRLGMHRLKNELEGAAFEALYRRQYERVTSISDGLSTSTMESMLKVLQKVQKEMTNVLSNDSEFSYLVKNFEVSARVKEPYSLWKKMLRNSNEHFLQVPDALALRIVLDAKKLSPDEPATVTRARERALCYYAQKLCTQNWKPLEGNPRFKDYIDAPKANGYQSLHYTAQAQVEEGEDDWTMEIQIRSGHMHQVAEFGLASHWDYKESQQKDSSATTPAPAAVQNSSADVDTVDSYLRKVKEWHWQQRFGTTSREEAKKSLADSPTSDGIPSLADTIESKMRVDRIRARTQRLVPYIEALAAEKTLAREHVFVFVKDKSGDSKVLALKSDACVLDALREGEKNYGYPLRSLDEQLVLNGSPTAVTHKLRNGDVLTVPLLNEPQRRQRASSSAASLMP